MFVLNSSIRVENGLLPGRLLGEGGYLGWEILMAWRA